MNRKREELPENPSKESQAESSGNPAEESQAESSGNPAESIPYPHTSKGLISAFRYALQGFSHTILTQRNMRIHLFITALVIIAGVIVRLDRLEWAIVSICIGLVLASELINTALESIVDIASPAFHPKAKIAKDTAAAAVFVFSVVSVIVGLLVFFSALDRLTN
jgi:diacylglycerol kinase